MGIAVGLTSAIFYLGCIVIMLSLGREGTVRFFNSILHGLETEPIIRMQIPLWEALLGIFEIFILGWFAGALIATLYNLLKRRNT